MARTILFDFKANTRAARRGFARMERGLKSVRRGYRQTRAAARDLRQGNGSLVMSFLRLGGGVGRLGIGVGQLAAGPLGILGRALGGILQIARSVIGTLTKLTLGVGVLGAAIGGKALAEFASYEREMVRVRAITQASDEDWRRMESTIKDVILTSEFMPAAIVDAAKNLAALGVSGVDDFERMLPAARAFATVLGVDINQAALILKATMNQFGLETRDAMDVVDVFANSWANSAADAPKLADALKYIGFTASASGESLRDTVAVIEALVDRGMEASMAGTALRNVFLTLQEPTDAGVEALREMGLTVEDVSIAQTDLITVLRRLSEAEMNADQAGRIFNMRGTDAARVLSRIFDAAEGSAKSIMQYRRELDDTGRVTGMINVLNDTLAQRWDVLKGSVSGLFISLGDLIARSADVKGGVSDLAGGVNELSDALSRISRESVRGLFSAIGEDITSGKAISLIGDAFMELFFGLTELAVSAGADIGKAMMRGMLQGLGIPQGAFGDRAGVASDWLREQGLGTPREGIGRLREMQLRGEIGPTDAAVIQQGLFELSQGMFAGTRAGMGRFRERMQGFFEGLSGRDFGTPGAFGDILDEVRYERFLERRRATADDRGNPGPPPIQVNDNRVVTNYRVGSARDEARPRGRRLNGLTGEVR